MIFLYILLIVIALLFYVLYNGPVSFYLFFFLLILPVVGFIWLFIASRRIKIGFRSDSRVYPKGHDSPFLLSLENKSSLLIPNAVIFVRYLNSLTNKGSVIKIVTPIYAKNTQLLRISVTSEHYGSISANIEKIKLFDFLKISRLRLSSKRFSRTPVSVTFIPEYIPLDNNVTNYADYGLESDRFSEHKPGDDPSEIFDIHEYQYGDRISRIHWKLTAKSDTTYVKEYSLPISNSICLAANAYIKDNTLHSLEKYDAVVEAFYAIGAYLSENAAPHTMIWYDDINKSLIDNISQEIEDDTDSIRRYLKCARSSKDHAVLYEYLSSVSENTRFGHFVYITNTINEKVLELLEASELSIRYTVLLSNDSTTGLEGIYDNIEIINIQPSKIEQSIEELLL